VSRHLGFRIDVICGHVRQLKLAGLQAHRLSILPGDLVAMLAAFKVFGVLHMTPSEPGLRLGVAPTGGLHRSLPMTTHQPDPAPETGH
jgi:exopolyphosphatase/pppGpp-phosphohydrolase